jgi:hypothetical protein
MTAPVPTPASNTSKLISHWTGKIQEAVAAARATQESLDLISAMAQEVKGLFDDEIQALETRQEGVGHPSMSYQLLEAAIDEAKASPAYKLCVLILKLNPALKTDEEAHNGHTH